MSVDGSAGMDRLSSRKMATSARPAGMMMQQDGSEALLLQRMYRDGGFQSGRRCNADPTKGRKLVRDKGLRRRGAAVWHPISQVSFIHRWHMAQQAGTHRQMRDTVGEGRCIRGKEATISRCLVAHATPEADCWLV